MTHSAGDTFGLRILSNRACRYLGPTEKGRALKNVLDCVFLLRASRKDPRVLASSVDFLALFIRRKVIFSGINR